MTHGASDRTEDGMSAANGSGLGAGAGAGGAWTSANGLGTDPQTPGAEPDPFGPDPFAPDTFGEEHDPFPMPGAAPAAGVAASFGTAAPAASENAGELDLGDGEMRLPWLEGDDEDYEDERGGMGQTTILLLAALVAIALLGGGILWALAGRSDEELVADGGVIEAPEEPYKTRPENPGGEVVSGTGDTSFAVAEGEARTPQIAEEELPQPGFGGLEDEEPSAAAAQPQSNPKPAPAAKAEEPAAPSGVGVQVGAYTSREGAEKGWQTLKGQYAPFGEMNHRVVQGQADIGTVYRLQAVPGDLKAARALCANMRGAGLACQVKN